MHTVKKQKFKKNRKFFKGGVRHHRTSQNSNIFFNIFYMVKRKLPAEKTLYSTCMKHDMTKSLLAFAVSSTPETPSFGTFGGVAHPP